MYTLWSPNSDVKYALLRNSLNVILKTGQCHYEGWLLVTKQGLRTSGMADRLGMIIRCVVAEILTSTYIRIYIWCFLIQIVLYVLIYLEYKTTWNGGKCSTATCPGGRFKNAYELLTLRALKISMFHKRFIFQCMGKIFCVEFQRYTQNI